MKRAQRNLRQGPCPEAIAGAIARLVGRFGLAAVVRVACRVPESA